MLVLLGSVKYIYRVFVTTYILLKPLLDEIISYSAQFPLSNSCFDQINYYKQTVGELLDTNGTIPKINLPNDSCRWTFLAAKLIV